MQSHSWDVEEFININGNILWSCGFLDAGSAEVERMEVCDVTLFSFSPIILPYLAGDEAVQTVS